MKLTKKSNKKLYLNKVTIAHLEVLTMNKIHGGVDISSIICRSEVSTICKNSCTPTCTCPTEMNTDEP